MVIFKCSINYIIKLEKKKKKDYKFKNLNLNLFKIK